MYHKILKTARIHSLFVCIDDKLAEITRSNNCLNCGGPLHQADYPRSPLGLPAHCREHYDSRRSFCCGKCRKRTTTPSVRFFGRHRYPAVIILLISAFMSRNSRRRYHQVTRYFGMNISRRTWMRWRRWWRECLIGTAFWKYSKSLLPAKALGGFFPHQLILNYSGRLDERLESALQFLAPLTAGFYRAV